MFRRENVLLSFLFPLEQALISTLQIGRAELLLGVAEVRGVATTNPASPADDDAALTWEVCPATIR